MSDEGYGEACATYRGFRHDAVEADSLEVQGYLEAIADAYKWFWTETTGLSSDVAELLRRVREADREYLNEWADC